MISKKTNFILNFFEYILIKYIKYLCFFHSLHFKNVKIPSLILALNIKLFSLREPDSNFSSKKSKLLWILNRKIIQKCSSDLQCIIAFRMINTQNYYSSRTVHMFLRFRQHSLGKLCTCQVIPEFQLVHFANL